MINTFLIALGLSMDSLAVAIAIGGVSGRLVLKNAFRVGIFFGFTQGLMPLIGWITGVSLREFITGIDHWIAFGLLSLIGGRMVWASFKKKKKEEAKMNFNSNSVLLMLSLATSVDALVVGISFGFLKANIWNQALVIGTATFLLSFLGVMTGKRLNNVLKNKTGVFGGLILIAIGIKILIQHLGSS